MNTTTIVIIVAAIALIAFYLYNRSKPAPRGTYDDKNVRSSGSIGGGTRAHDAPDVRSSGSIGGGTRANDSSAHTSGGSIGGRQRSENSSTQRAASHTSQTHTTTPEPRVNSSARVNSNAPVNSNGSERTSSPLTNGIRSTSDHVDSVQQDSLQEDEQLVGEKEHNDKFNSGGSFGGSRK